MDEYNSLFYIEYIDRHRETHFTGFISGLHVISFSHSALNRKGGGKILLNKYSSPNTSMCSPDTIGQRGLIKNHH